MHSLPPPLLGFRRALEQDQPGVPKPLEVIPEPLQALRTDPVEPPGPGAAFGDESGALEHADVLRDGRPGDVEVRSDLACREFPPPNQIQDCPAPGLRDSADGSVHNRYLRQVIP